MGLQTAVALESVALVRSVHTEACLQPGRAARVLERVAGPRVENRVLGGIREAHPQASTADGRFSGPATPADVRAGHHGSGSGNFANVFLDRPGDAARGCRWHSRLLPGAIEDRKYRIMEQVSAPHRYWQAIAAEELARFPGWAPEGVARSSVWDYRTEAEWQAADLIWVPSPHLIGNSKEFGADPLKFHVIPFPIPRPQPAGQSGIRGTSPARGFRRNDYAPEGSPIHLRSAT